MRLTPITTAVVTTLLASHSSSARPSTINCRQAGGIDICAAVEGTSNGCVESSAVPGVPLFFVCSNNVQTLFTCDGGCKQKNAANLPTCDNGVIFTGKIV